MAKRSGFDAVFLNEEGEPLNNLNIRVLNSDGNLAQIYNTKTGTSLKAQPIVTNAANNGLVQFWAEPGYYEVEVSDTEIPARISSRVVPFDAVAGDTTLNNEGISLSQLPTIVESKIGTNAVTRNKILNGEIVESKIGTNAVTRNKILNGEVTDSKIATDAVVASKIAPQVIDFRTSNVTLVSSDAWKMILVNSSSNLQVIVNSGTNFAVGDSVEIIRYGTGTVTFAETSPTVLSSTPSKTLRARYSGATLVCVNTNVYLLMGDLT
jgi:hypothetical protein